MSNPSTLPQRTIRRSHRELLHTALEATESALRSARLHGRRTDCLECAVRDLLGAVRCAEWEDDTWLKAQDDFSGDK